MEHRHGCVYCGTDWFCYEQCPLEGPSVCAECRDKLSEAPETPRRVIPLEGRDNWVFDRLAEYDAERIRQSLRRKRPESSG